MTTKQSTYNLLFSYYKVFLGKSFVIQKKDDVRRKHIYAGVILTFILLTEPPGLARFRHEK